MTAYPCTTCIILHFSLRWACLAGSPAERISRKVREHRQRLRAQGMRPIQLWVLVLIVQEDGFAERDSVTMCMSSSDPINLSELRILAEQR